MDYNSIEAEWALLCAQEFQIARRKSELIDAYFNPRPDVVGFQYGQTTTKSNKGRKLKSLMLNMKLRVGKNAESGVERPAPDAAQNDDK